MERSYLRTALIALSGSFVLTFVVPFIFGLGALLASPRSSRASARRPAASSSSFFKGRHALITGGSSGIGRACAAALVESGAKVTIVARSLATLTEAKSSLETQGQDVPINAIQADVTVQSSLDDAAAQAEQVLGPISLLICSAGISEPTVLEDMESSEFERVMKVNWLGVVHSIKAALPSMKRAGGGDIVLVSSLAGQVGLYGYTAYSSSKFALRGLVEALQMELEQYNIRILTVFPPNTNTPLLSRENEIKPEITRMLEDEADTLEPEAIAKIVLSGIRKGNAQIATSLDGWMLAILTCGMLRPHSITSFAAEIFLLPLVRALATMEVAKWYRKISKFLRRSSSGQQDQSKAKTS